MTTRLVVADDQDVVRGGFAMLLDAQPDLEVVGEAADGAEAVRLAAAAAPDVVLMDVRMPVMDGVEATRRICAHAPRAVWVLILTTFDLDEVVYDALHARRQRVPAQGPDPARSGRRGPDGRGWAGAAGPPPSPAA